MYDHVSQLTQLPKSDNFVIDFITDLDDHFYRTIKADTVERVSVKL